MKRRNLLIIVGVTVAGAALAVLIRAGGRNAAINAVLQSHPEIRARLAVMPHDVLLPGPEPVNRVTLGYATMDTGQPGPVLVLATGSGDWLLLKSEQMEVNLAAPFSLGELGSPASSASGSGASGAGDSVTSRLLQRAVTDPIGAQREIEATRLQSMWQTLFMSGDDFAVYVLKLGEKAGNRVGWNEVIFYTAPHARGVVRIGENPKDRRHAFVWIASLDGTKNVGLKITMTPDSPGEIRALLDPMLGSFQFTIDAVESREQIRKLIAEAGIPRRQTTRPSAPVDETTPAR